MAETTDSANAAVEPAFLAAPTGVQSDRAPLGPGLWESLLWILGFFLLEIAGSFVWGFGAMIYAGVTTGRMPAPSELEKLLQPVMPWMIGSLKLLEVIGAAVAIRLRFGREAFRITGFGPVPLTHLVVLGFAVIPTAFLSGQCFALFQGYWDQLAEYAPWLSKFNDMSSIPAVEAMAKATPLAVLVFIIALLPALNEEFLFRAIIGRGLVGRYGIVAGVALTTMLFAAVHLSPVHAAALVPLAVLLHVGYLSSRSIWAPVAVHFCNNALSVALMKAATLAPDFGGIATEVGETKFAPLLFVSSLACVVATVLLLWRMRTRWMLPDGSEWHVAGGSLEAPPAATRSNPSIAPGLLVITAACYLSFPVAFVVTAWLKQL